MDREQLKLNADIGEGLGNDASIMPFLVMCNISCGAHAGGLSEIEKAIRLAQKYSVKIGAHPSYPDKEHFGRKVLNISNEELFDSLSKQLHDFQKIATRLNEKVNHIKAHGALYHQVIEDQKVRSIFLQAIEENCDDIKIVIPASCHNKNVSFGKHHLLYEAFSDRQYLPNLDLMSRTNAGAVITKTEDLASQLYKMLDCGKVYTTDGSWQDIDFDTICVHGDTTGIAERLPKAIALVKNHNL